MPSSWLLDWASWSIVARGLERVERWGWDGILVFGGRLVGLGMGWDGDMGMEWMRRGGGLNYFVGVL